MFKNIFLLLACLYILSTNLLAQSKGYEIKVKITPLKNVPIYLGYHFGDNQYVVDTTYLNENSTGIFKKNNNLPEGMYLIVLPNMKYFNILLTKNQQLIITNDTTNLYQNLIIENDEENIFFAQYQKQLYLLKKQINILEPKINQYPDSANIYNTIINDEQNKLVQLKEKWIEKNPNSLLSKIFKALDTKDFNFDATIFFKDVDFTDSRLLFTPAFSKTLDEFFTSLPSLSSLNIDSLYKAIDYIFMQSMKNPSVYEEISKYLISQFDLSGNYPNPDAFWYIADKYFLSGLTPWINEAFKTKLSKYNQRIESICMNHTFPSLYLNDEFEKKYNVLDTKAENTLLVFWNPECEHCIHYLKKLYNLYLNTSRTKLEVVAILTGNNKDLWKKEIKNYNWKNLYDSKLLNDFIEDLFLYNTPQIFLLDKNKKIIAKDITVEELTYWIK
ncbi:MAG: redoxin domain-containing protein [Bacteroidales bacterium]|nr:redoxin domain-containing protein [Bacteroidales bacterium]